MSQETQIRPSEGLRHVKYEIRGRLARRAQELERQGYEIVPLNIGNPGAFGFRTPETMRLAMIENMAVAEGYCHQKGIFPAREAVVMQQQSRGVTGISAEEVFIGNGVSELIDLCLRALLNPGDEVLIPEPRLSTVVGGGHAEWRQGGVLPVPARERFRARIRKRSPRWSRARRAPSSSSTLTIRPARCIRARCAKASRSSPEANKLVVFSDEIYDQMTYDGVESIPMATLVRDTVCCTMSGLSKIYRACGYRVGWAAFSGNLRGAGDYLVRARVAVARCGCARTCRRSGRCRPRSVATRASRNCSRRADACTNRAARFSKPRRRAASSHSRRPRVRCTPSCA